MHRSAKEAFLNATEEGWLLPALVSGVCKELCPTCAQTMSAQIDFDPKTTWTSEEFQQNASLAHKIAAYRPVKILSSDNKLAVTISCPAIYECFGD